MLRIQHPIIKMYFFILGKKKKRSKADHESFQSDKVLVLKDFKQPKRVYRKRNGKKLGVGDTSQVHDSPVNEQKQRGGTN